jgi:SpoVK/Ycf46/Vps4 family AAA+-type ATPase
MNKIKTDPERINKYNKFLSTLDKSSKATNHMIKETNNNSGNLKTTIEEILGKITNDFFANNYNSSDFTGKIVLDNYTNLTNDANIYKDLNVYNKKTKEKKLVTINSEIKNISDILMLVKTYKNDPFIEYNINIKMLHDIKEPLTELNNMIGMEELKNNIVDQILYFMQELHLNNDCSGDFMHTVIYGPPGTGKTEIAKIMGKIYSKIGILKSGKFKKVTRSDLVAGYLGQTALKTRDVINEALGGVLFIDEAYSLGNDKKDTFSKECIDTLCEALSDNKDKLMVIIAGYENELKEGFFNVNQGLESRFTWRFKTDEYTGEDLYNIFVKKVNEIGWELHENSNITPSWFIKNKENFKFYGRDIEVVLSKTKIAHSKRVYCKPINEKKKLILSDLENGFERYLKNNDVKSKKEAEKMKKEIYYSLYC